MMPDKTAYGRSAKEDDLAQFIKAHTNSFIRWFAVMLVIQTIVEVALIKLF
jgi:hypothetical protein